MPRSDNQWPVNFNLELPSFEPFVEGTLGLIRLSASSHKSPPIYFTSSIGTVSNWIAKYPGRPVPEISLDDPTIAIGQGYSESKWVAERLLDAAGKHSGVSSAILRIGQIAGPVEGARARRGIWNRQEWVPSVSYEVSVQRRNESLG
jgi:thioester reductase-like protein